MALAYSLVLLLVSCWFTCPKGIGAKSCHSSSFETWRNNRIFSIKRPPDDHWRFLAPCRDSSRSCVELLPLRNGSVTESNTFTFRKEHGEITVWRNQARTYLGITKCGTLTLHAEATTNFTNIGVKRVVLCATLLKTTTGASFIVSLDNSDPIQVPSCNIQTLRELNKHGVTANSSHIIHDEQLCSMAGCLMTESLELAVNVKRMKDKRCKGP